MIVNFQTLQRNWIMECVTKAMTSIFVNGSSIDDFKMERGLRQGDSLSPFLFLLATKGLHVMMKATVEAGLFTSYKVVDFADVSLSHLQFADDTLFIGEKSWAHVRTLKVDLILF